MPTPSLRFFRLERAVLGLLRPPRRRGTAHLVMGTMLAAIGVIDCVSGIHVSLAIFYLVPITLATGWYGPRTAVGVVVLCNLLRVVGDIVDYYPERLPIYTWWNVGATTTIFLFIVWLVGLLLRYHRRLQRRVIRRTQELRRSIARGKHLERELVDVGARERQLIGRELHDELGQHLTATALAAQTLAQQLGTRPEASKARAIASWVEEGTAKARKLARGLLLSEIPPDRLGAELEELAHDIQAAGSDCRLIVSPQPLRCAQSTCAQLFRIAQEAVTNALRHGQAKSITLTLAGDDAGICLVIEDDGQGFQLSQTKPGLGVEIMRQRSALIGATLAIDSFPGEGTRVTCTLPLSVPSHAA